MDKIIKSSFIIYLLLFFIKIINSQTVQVFDISDQSIDTYNKYLTISTLNYCTFDIYILSVFDIELDGESFSISTNFTPPSITKIEATLKLTNDTSQIHLLKFQNIYNGQYTIEIQSNIYDFYSGSTIVNLNCELYDEKSLEFEFTSNNRKEVSIFSSNGIMTVKGLKYKGGDSINMGMAVLGISFYDKSKGLAIYSFGVLQKPNDSFLSNVNYTINFSNFSKNITITPVYNYYSNNQNNICLIYPQVKNFTKNSYFGTAIYTVLTNYTDNEPLLLGIFSTKSINFQKPTPAYQTENGIVYIEEFYGLGNVNLEVYTQYGSSVVLINNSTIKINDIESKSSVPLEANSIIYDNPNIGNHNYSKSMFTFDFNSTSKFDNIKMTYSHRWFSTILEWPFGFESGNNLKYYYRSSFLQELASPNHLSDSSINIQLDYYLSQNSKLSNLLSVDQNNNNIPIIEIKLVEFKHLYHSNYLVRIILSENINGRIVQLDSDFYNLDEFLVQDNSVDGGGESVAVYEINIKTQSIIFQVTFLDLFGNRYYGNSLNQEFYSINPPNHFDSSPFEWNILEIENVSFLFNNIDTTNRSVDNIMYLNYPDPNALISIYFLYHYSIGNDQNLDNTNYAMWNSTIKMFQVEFTIPANFKSGLLSYAIIMGIYSSYSYYLPDSYQLNVTSSKFDFYGPIFKTIIKSSSINPNYVKWLLEIEDQINGFKSGEIIVWGELDGSIYKYQLTTLSRIGGDEFLGQYEIVVNISNVCALQNYVITDIKLYDSQGFFSEFSQTGSFIQKKNPFINYLYDPLINKIQLDCSFIDDSPPILLSFKSWKTISNDEDTQALFFEFNVTDPESGIKEGQSPIVYSTTSLLNTIYNSSEIKSIDGDIITYSCMINVPFGFAYNSDVIFSVYGLINNGGYYSGYSTKRIQDEVSSTDFKMTGFILSKKPIIKSTTDISSSGGGLLIKGNNFKSGDIVEINYGDSFIGRKISIPNYIYSSSIFINDIIPTRLPFTIKIKQLNGNDSKEFKVYPKVFNFNYNDPEPTPEPTNEPMLCSGNPECGGVKNGYCKQNYGCICYSPWVGIDCTSMVIIVPQPQPNTTNPTTSIPIGDNDDGSNNPENIIFQSLISLISLREVDFNSNPVNTFKFEKWIYSKIDNFTNKYETNITVPPIGPNENSTITTIIATLQWFKEKSNIIFANQNLTMNPSTMKYTIELSQYKFKNKLNGLQLIMSASLSSSKTDDICSDKQFGQTTDEFYDISNYLKIQVGDHSLYGRFIKRAIVDSLAKTISNELLDSSMNPISSASSSQSFIGIILPNFANSIIIDPDFSVLIDSKAASSSDNSICTNNDSNLTKAQLAGIIVEKSKNLLKENGFKIKTCAQCFAFLPKFYVYQIAINAQW
ncbi:hypothetical protein ACTFIZ_002078 [Dictyostelium cf. discoideum]